MLFCCSVAKWSACVIRFRRRRHPLSKHSAEPKPYRNRTPPRFSGQLRTPVRRCYYYCQTEPGCLELLPPLESIRARVCLCDAAFEVLYFIDFRDSRVPTRFTLKRVACLLHFPLKRAALAAGRVLFNKNGIRFLKKFGKIN